VGIAFCAVWYFTQPAERQTDIEEKVGQYLDSSAEKVGGAISNVAARVKKPKDDGFPQTVPELTERFFRRPEGKIFGGMPRPTDKYPYKINVLQNKGYVVGYCEERRGAAWVAYKATSDKRLDFVAPRPRFIVDKRTNAKVAPDDYKFSGYEKAFLASPYIVGIGCGDEACKRTFFMSNVAPQKHELNVKWEQLQRKIARTYARKFGDIWIFAGPIHHGNAGTMRSGIEIPDEYFLIVVRTQGKGFDALAFVLDQDASQREWLNQYLTSVDRIEELTHFDFFQKLPKKIEEPLESHVARKLW
jgi:endonuclease G